MADIDSILLPTLREEFIDFLINDPYRVTFTKADGSERVMLCTLDPALMPPQDAPRTRSARTAAQTFPVVVAFDLELEEWRSFRTDRVTKFELA